LSGDSLQFEGFLNKRSENILAAGLSIGRTIFICIALTFGAIMFTKDAQDLALGPIEKMIRLVNKIARNPIESKELDIKRG